MALYGDTINISTSKPQFTREKWHQGNVLLSYCLGTPHHLPPIPIPPFQPADPILLTSRKPALLKTTKHSIQHPTSQNKSQENQKDLLNPKSVSSDEWTPFPLRSIAPGFLAIKADRDVRVCQPKNRAYLIKFAQIKQSCAPAVSKARPAPQKSSSHPYLPPKYPR